MLYGLLLLQGTNLNLKFYKSLNISRADEVGTVNGSLDLLMDSLLGSIGPLLANLTKLPVFQGDQELAQQLWNASAVHIPTFQ